MARWQKRLTFEHAREMFSLLAQVLSNTEIAARLYFSEGTARNHVNAIFTKLNVIDRTQAAVLACIEIRSRLTFSPVFTQ